LTPANFKSKARAPGLGQGGIPRRCKQPDLGRPCTCAMGNVSRFIEPVVLRILREKKGSYGYEIADCLAQYALTDATIEGAALYRTLRALEANRYVSSKWEAGSGPARRKYALTRRGMAHLREWTHLLETLGAAMIEFARSIEFRGEAATGGNKDSMPPAARLPLIPNRQSRK
jgi:DNA-binding PadR family transcriptional regulator